MSNDTGRPYFRVQLDEATNKNKLDENGIPKSFAKDITLRKKMS